MTYSLHGTLKIWNYYLITVCLDRLTYCCVCLLDASYCVVLILTTSTHNPKKFHNFCVVSKQIISLRNCDGFSSSTNLSVCIKEEQKNFFEIKFAKENKKYMGIYEINQFRKLVSFLHSINGCMGKGYPFLEFK